VKPHDDGGPRENFNSAGPSASPYEDYQGESIGPREPARRAYLPLVLDWAEVGASCRETTADPIEALPEEELDPTPTREESFASEVAGPRDIDRRIRPGQ
jgi:hypothetical protein